MKRAKYVCLEGTEGVGKTTQTQKLVDFLKSRDYKVLHTKEPGTPHAELTMTLRGIMLDNKYDKELTKCAREFISQAIRSIHLEKVIAPALSEYDFIVQDRGILSGYSYGYACGNNVQELKYMASLIMSNLSCIFEYTANAPEKIYDHVVYLKGDIKSGLDKALSSKQEFETGDAMESRGLSFLDTVSKKMDELSLFFNTTTVDINGKSIEQVHQEILDRLELKEFNGIFK